MNAKREGRQLLITIVAFVLVALLLVAPGQVVALTPTAGEQQQAAVPGALITETNAPAAMPQATPVEPARYNLATVQGERELQTVAGQTVTTRLAFYNTDGNRTTQIRLEAQQAPAGWKIEIVVPGATGGNELAVAPTAVQVIPVQEAIPGKTQVYLAGKGYAEADEVQVLVTAPAGAAGAGTVQIRATATWAGQTGEVTLMQTRDFQYNVRVVAQGEK